KLGRATPAVPCTVYFEEHEWKALVAFTTQCAAPPPTPPSLWVAMLMDASLGGWLGRKRDGPPGALVLWRVLQR
ncbi:MAG: IS4 family transposase, partial [Verrucomicrobia bacterium]|nr:IS4 family transposase [Verrucomicrobiota bacterium]